MRKILALLGAVSLTATSAMTVIACANEEIESNGLVSNSERNDINKLELNTSLGTIAIPDGFSAPTLQSLIDGFNSKNRNVVSLQKDDWKFKGTPESKKAIIEATGENFLWKGQIELSYDTTIKPKAPLSYDLTTKQFYVPFNPKTKDILKGLEQANEDLIVSELQVELVNDTNSAIITVKPESKIYHSNSLAITVYYVIDQRLDLNYVIKNKELTITNIAPSTDIEQVITEALQKDTLNYKRLAVEFSGVVFKGERKMLVKIKANENYGTYKNHAILTVNFDMPQTFLEWEFRAIGGVYGNNWIPLEIKISKSTLEKDYKQKMIDEVKKIVKNVDYDHINFRETGSISGLSRILIIEPKKGSPKYYGKFDLKIKIKLVD